MKLPTDWPANGANLARRWSRCWTPCTKCGKKMLPRNLRVFLDTSVIIAAVLSPGGGGRMLFRLAATGFLKIVLGPSVIRETDEVVRRKVPASLPDLANLLASARVEQGPGARPSDLERALELVN